MRRFALVIAVCALASAISCGGTLHSPWQTGHRCSLGERRRNCSLRRRSGSSEPTTLHVDPASLEATVTPVRNSAAFRRQLVAQRHRLPQGFSLCRLSERREPQPRSCWSNGGSPRTTSVRGRQHRLATHGFETALICMSSMRSCLSQAIWGNVSGIVGNWQRDSPPPDWSTNAAGYFRCVVERRGAIEAIINQHRFFPTSHSTRIALRGNFANTKQQWLCRSPYAQWPQYFFRWVPMSSNP